MMGFNTMSQVIVDGRTHWWPTAKIIGAPLAPQPKDPAK